MLIAIRTMDVGVATFSLTLNKKNTCVQEGSRISKKLSFVLDLCTYILDLEHVSYLTIYMKCKKVQLTIIIKLLHFKMYKTLLKQFFDKKSTIFILFLIIIQIQGFFCIKLKMYWKSSSLSEQQKKINKSMSKRGPLIIVILI